jgi:Uma2 family endonuclease
MTTLAPKISVEEYLARERQAEIRSEYLAGQIVTMSGASLSHTRIVTNILKELADCLAEKDCEIVAVDMRVHIPACDRYVYPDLVIICGVPVLKEDEYLDTLLNPTVIIEVLSPSTSDYDRNNKARCYFTLPSLQSYYLIPQNREEPIEVFTRQAEYRWELTLIQNVGTERVEIAGCEVAVEEIYRKVK